MKRERIKIAIQNPNSDRDVGLPEHLLEEIFTRLPLNKIFMLRTVSKRWDSIVSTKDFRKFYMAKKEQQHGHSTDSALLLLLRTNDCENILKPPVDDTDHPESTSTCSSINDRNGSPFTMLGFPFPKLQPDDNQIDNLWYEVVSSQKGLLLCRVYDDSEIIYGICSAKTRQWIPITRQSPIGIPSIKHPAHVHITTWEGFVAKVDKSSSRLISYRVVRLVQESEYHLNRKKLYLEIYNSDRKEWTRSNVILPDAENFHIAGSDDLLQPACLNNIIHWEIRRSCGIRLEIRYSIAIDPYKHGEDQCRLMVLPTASTFSYNTRTTLLGVCNEKLQYLKVDVDDRIAIWVLEDYYDEETWELKHMITCMNLTDPDRPAGFYKPIAFHPLDSNVIYMSAKKSFAAVMVFDIEEKTLVPLSSTDRVRCYRDMIPFVLPFWPIIIGCPL